jgi:hypothetical protein
MATPQLNTPRKEVQKMASKWRRCRDVVAGEDAVKARGEEYLPRLTAQQQEEYDAYKMRAMFYGGTGRTKKALVGLVLWKDPTVEFPDAYETQLDDITMDGTPLAGFIAHTIGEVLEVGRFGFLIDAAPDPQAQVRPYWVRYRAEDIINWSTVRRNGDQVLTLVVLRECVETVDPNTGVVAEVEQWRVLRLEDPLSLTPTYTSQVYTKTEQGSVEVLMPGEKVTPMRRGQPLSFIPFSFVGPDGIGPDVCDPPLADMASVNLSHYRSSADLEHGRHFCGLPTLWVCGLPSDAKEIRVGATAALVLEGPNAGCGYAEFTGQGLGALENALKDKKEDMAVLGARLVDGNAGTNETAESVRARQMTAFATLMSIASSVSRAITNGLRWHAFWLGVDKPEAATPPIACDLNTDYFLPTLDANTLRTLLLSVQAGVMSFETFYWNLARGSMARPNVDAKSEMDTITSEEAFRAANDAVLLTGAGAKSNPATNPDNAPGNNQPPVDKAA